MSGPGVQMSRVVRGRVISGQELKDYAERHGLCTICGQYQTHERRGNWMRTKFEPMTVTNNKGIVTVYKGYCIQPTCYPSVDFVKELLGEIPKKRKTVPRSSGSGDSGNSGSGNGNGGGRGSGAQQPRQNTRPPQPADVSPLQQHGARERARPQETSHFSHRNQGLEQSGRTHYSQFSSATGATSSAHSRYTQQHHRQTTPDDISFVPGETRYTPQRNTSSFDGNGSSGAFTHGANGSNGAFDHDFNTSGVLGDSSAHGMDHLGLLGHVGEEEEEKHEETTDPELEALDAQLSEGDYIGFLNRLDDPGIQHYIALDGLSLFRKWVIRDQMEKPDGVVLGFDGWVKTIKTLVEERFPGDRDMTAGGLATLLTLSTLSGNYRKYMIKRGGISMLFKVVDEFADDKDMVNVACATVSSICSSEKEGLSARHDSQSVNVIRKLVQIVVKENGNGKEYALLALNHLANQRRKNATTNKTLANDIKIRLSEEETALGEIINIIRQPGVNQKVAEAGMNLFWRLSFPKEDEEGTLPVSAELVETALFALSNFYASDTQLATCGLIANLALDERFPPDHAPKLMEAVCEVLCQDSVDESLAVCGVHACCNLLSNDKLKRLVVNDPQLIPATFAMMMKFPGCEDLIEFGCLTIAQVARDDTGMKDMVVGQGGFGLVHRAFEHFVTLRGADPSLVIKDAALCALAALSGCNTGTQELVNSGLLEDLSAMFAVETDEDFRCILQAILQNAQTVQSFGGGSRGGGGGGRLGNDPQAFANLVGSASSENEVYTLLEQLSDMGQAGLPAVGDRGFDTLLNVLSNFRRSSLVQEKGCAVLAQAYYHLPFSAVNAPVQIPNGSWAVIHKVEVFETIHRAMTIHRHESGVQSQACLAIYNYLSSMYENKQALQEISRWTRPFLKEVRDAIGNCPSDDGVLRHGLSLFGLLALVQESGDVRQWRLPVLQTVFDTRSRFASDAELKEICFGLLVGCEGDLQSMEFIANSGGVNLFLSSLGPTEDVDIVCGSSQMLAALLKSVFSASAQVSQMPHAAQVLVDCIASRQPDPHIPVNICSVFEALYNFGDFSAMGSAMGERMVRVLCDVLVRQGDNNHALVEKACRVLSLIIPSMELEVIDSMRNVLGPAFTRVLNENMEHPEVGAAAMDALWTCCDQLDYFKHSLINEPSLRMIVRSMSLNLGSAELQRSGCSLLWILSGYGHGREMIGEFGGVSAVVNAMLAHNQSTVVQKEGLTVLKNLATASINKSLITSTGGEDSVRYALWIHYREPQVISIALSALNNIAVDSEARSVAVMEENIMNIVIGAMRRFPREETVQKNSCFYLKSCSYSRANLALMHQNRIELTRALQRASTSFPEACRDRASSVISRIEQFQ